MSVKRILVLGGGFAGLWSAIGAARKLDELGYGPDAVQVTLVNRDGFHSIRVRTYEADLSQVRVPLDDVLVPDRHHPRFITSSAPHVVRWLRDRGQPSRPSTTDSER
jgi:NADH dehydrogenase FAD-containing subunit